MNLSPGSTDPTYLITPFTWGLAIVWAAAWMLLSSTGSHGVYRLLAGIVLILGPLLGLHVGCRARMLYLEGTPGLDAEPVVQLAFPVWGTIVGLVAAGAMIRACPRGTSRAVRPQDGRGCVGDRAS